MKLETSPDGRSFPVMFGVEPVIEGVWQWIRGLHTFLYGEFLGVKLPHGIWPPNPGYDSRLRGGFDLRRDGLSGMQAFEKEKTLRGLLLDAALKFDSLDLVTAWNEELSYRCAWIPLQKANKGQHRCIWALTFPGLEQYCPEIKQRTVPSWLGEYVCIRPPKCRSMITNEMLRQYCMSNGIK